jgi:undecaprenyl-diphosphatase
MNEWHAVVLGIVEGLTEFLPVSSTGHLILASRWMGLPETEFMKSFQIAIQLGGILAVVAVYWRSFLKDIETMKRVLAGVLPTLAVGFVLYRMIKESLMTETTVLWSLAIGGVVLIVFDLLHKEKEDCIEEIPKLPYRKAFLIGLIQSLAVIPGVSRAAATIVGGLALGLKRKAVVEFSFLLAVPTIAAAAVFDLAKNGSSFGHRDWDLLLWGAASSFAVAWASIKFFLHFVRNHGFLAFGVYRILAAGAFWFFVK